MVPRSAASSSENSVLPGTQPSCWARSQLRALLAQADDDVDAVVLHVERLAAALHAVAEDGDGFILQYILGLLQREFLAGDDFFDRTTKINLCHVKHLKKISIFADQ